MTTLVVDPAVYSSAGASLYSYATAYQRVFSAQVAALSETTNMGGNVGESIPPRALTDLETSVVTKLLSSNAPGASEYLAQVPYSQVVATWGLGSPSVDLAVRPGAVQAYG